MALWCIPIRPPQNFYCFGDRNGAVGLTLLKVAQSDGLWEQGENVWDYCMWTLHSHSDRFQEEQELRITFLAPRCIGDYFMPHAEVPVSQWQVNQHHGQKMMRRNVVEKSASWQQKAEEIVQVDEQVFTKDNKLKELQEVCKKLGLPSSGSKVKVLRRLRQRKHHQEEQMAFEIAQRLYSESRREAVPLKTPKLPTRHEQDLHNLAHIPFLAWCQTCVATRAKKDARPASEQSDKKDRGRSIIGFDYGFTFAAGQPEEKQFGTAVYVAESETKAVMCIPVLAKGSASLKQVTEEIIRFSLQVSNAQPVIFQSDGESSIERSTRRDQHASNSQAERAVQSVRKLANTL